MKNTLTLLAGFVFLIAILAAGGCNRGTKSNRETGREDLMKAVTEDTTKVDVFFEEIIIGGEMHLKMYDSKHSDVYVIDGLLTTVYRGYTVKWKKTENSNISDVISIRPKEDTLNIFPKEGAIGPDGNDKDYYKKIVIPDSATPGIIKYIIDFKLRDDDSTYTVDPYLEFPDEQ
jgi:hypothetical protein